ncbi:MAG: acyl-CoA dehydrogenase family protein [Acidimicrobiia bacterium]
MRVDLGPEIEEFRGEVRDWIEANRPEEMGELDERAMFAGGRGLGGRLGEQYQKWVGKLREGGWLCVSWPTEYGGRDLSPVQLAVLNEEFAKASLPRVTMGMGESLVGPAIIVHGTEEQKKHFLPRIIAGQDRYCQGFSEPNAGSDLASVQTKGQIDGDEIVVTGQKIWTSGASMANMIFTLVRTNPEVPKHDGISYVLIPMKDNNIEIRPIKQMSGASGFFETFFDGARAPLFNVIGGINGGWKSAMTTLGNERGGSATTQHLRYEREMWRLIELSKKIGKNTDPRIRQDLAWAYTQVQLMRYSGLRTLATLASRKEIGPEASVNKLFWSEYHKRLGEVAVNLLGPSAIATEEGDPFGSTRWRGTLLQSRAGTIFSGTSEIQKKIIGERALGLPKEPGLDREESN